MVSTLRSRTRLLVTNRLPITSPMSFMPISFVSRSVTFFPPPTPFIHSFFRTRLVWLGLDWIGLDCFGSVRLGFVFLVFFFLPALRPSWGNFSSLRPSFVILMGEFLLLILSVSKPRWPRGNWY